MPSRRQKLRAKIEQNPRNVRFEDLEKLLLAYGFTVRQPRSGSSHHYFQLRNEQETLIQFTIPFKRPHIKPVYVKLVLEALDTYFPELDSELEIGDNDDENS
jgi:hypothetical protein